MGAVIEDKAVTPRASGKVLGEGRSNKIIRKIRDKKLRKGLDIQAMVEATEQTSPDSDDTQDQGEKRAQGIVIDGKTYTCATCKTGHRVGICKHARERPMTATHPPGRPQAGAPKKVICDCPKQCNCKKRDCKCARRCSCTQPMYMLVYVPAPDEDDEYETKGSWKLGQQVTTDLKGNILTPEQVRQRKEQKEAQKSLIPDSRKAKVVAPSTVDSNIDSSQKVTPTSDVGCCKHKENITTKSITAQASPQSGMLSKSARGGCNCGTGCICAFCPEHPNNSTSINMARQQAVHFANQPHQHNPQNIVSFMPTMPQGASCMGGYPQFAISRYPEMPSFNDIQRTFPQPGYVIGYPIWSTRTDSTGYPLAPFPVQSSMIPNMGLATSSTLPNFHTTMQTTPLGTPHLELPSVDFSQDEFGIGNAFVASAGPGGWDQTLMSPSIWTMEGSAVSQTTPNFVDPLQVSVQSFEQPDMSNIQNNPAFDFQSGLEVTDDTALFDFANMTPPTPIVDDKPPSTVTKRSCCGEPQKADPAPDDYVFGDRPFSPPQGGDSTI